jgi:hypothetical protein
MGFGLRLGFLGFDAAKRLMLGVVGEGKGTGGGATGLGLIDEGSPVGLMKMT